jgi:hypothetical protein
MSEYEEDDERPFHQPVYPEITRAQWAVLTAMSDQRCANMIEAMDFVADLSPEAKEFLQKADRKKIRQLNENMDFFAASRTIWKFLWIGGGSFVGVVLGAIHLWKTFGEYFSVKLK